MLRWARAALLTAGLAVLPALHATWTWEMGGLQGGGLGQVIAVDPNNTGHATLGGDSWGVYNTTDHGQHWFAATNGLGIAGSSEVTAGDFFFMGVAYSQKHSSTGRVYAITGKLDPAGTGNFGMIEGANYTVLTRSVQGGEGGITSGDKPRPTGNRVVVDYDSSTGWEYIYVATGNGGGIVRLIDKGTPAPNWNTDWVTIADSTNGFTSGGVNNAITGMCIDPTNTNAMYVTTRGGAYRLRTIRTGDHTNVPVLALTGGPTGRLEEVASINGTIYVAAGNAGIYTVTVVSGAASWTRLDPTFFNAHTSANTSWESIGGSGTTLYAGCFKPNDGASCIVKSTSSGATGSWSSVTAYPANVSLTVPGSGATWWLANYTTNGHLYPGPNDTTFESTQIAVDASDPSIVYSSGHSGCWVSTNGGGLWEPAMNGLGGSMHKFVKASTGAGTFSANAEDEDFKNDNTSDAYFSVTQMNTGAPTTQTSTTDASGNVVITRGSNTYKVMTTVPRRMTLNGSFIDDGIDGIFQSTVIRPYDMDVSADGNYIYIALYGGGILVGHNGTWPP